MKMEEPIDLNEDDFSPEKEFFRNNLLSSVIDFDRNTLTSTSENHFQPQSSDTSGTKEQSNNGVKLTDPPHIGEILSTDEALITPTPHNVGVINAACQKVLKCMEQQLLYMLKKNKQEQENIQNFLNSSNKHVNIEETQKPHMKCMGMPYFKDLHGYPPPVNKDVLKKKKNSKILPAEFIEISPVWSSVDAKNLIKAVDKILPHMRHDQPVDPESIDWLKISATDLEGKFSPSECKSKWTMNLAPNVNRSRWKIKEIQLLTKVAERHDCQDWDKIANELNTGRTCFQCCVQYRTYKGSDKGKWTKEEDEALMKIINQYKVKDIIPWKKVAWHFEHRSLRQCHERYAYHIGGLKKGVFSIEEDFVITYLATKMKNFGEVAKYIPKRAATQVRARYEYLVNISMPKFTKEEDDLLTYLMVKYPRNWSKISEAFQNRSKLQCRRRWAAIQNSIKLENGIFTDIESEENRELLGSTKYSSRAAQSIIDSQNITKNLRIIPKTEKINKKHPKEYVDLINYHKNCYKFLFGPKTGIPGIKEEFEWLIKKVKYTMQSLTISSSLPISPKYNVASLANNCEFDDQDLSVLKEIQTSKELKEEGLRNKVIPPNYVTLVGIRTLLLGWNKMRNLSCSYNSETESTVRSLNKRMLCSDSKKLFKSRMKALFVFPIILSNITQDNIKVEMKRKPKVRKQRKPLSKRKRKKHAKLMSSIYRNRKNQDREEASVLGDETCNEECESESKSENSVREKRKRRRRSIGSESKETITVKRSKCRK